MPLSSRDWLDLALLASQGFGQAAAGAATGKATEQQGRISEAELAQRQREAMNKSNLDRYLAMLAAGNQELAQREFQLTAPDTRANQVIRGDVMANIRDVNIDAPEGVPEFNFSGGLRPSLLGPNSRQFGQLMSRQALLNQMPSGGMAGPSALAKTGGLAAGGAEGGPRGGGLVNTSGIAKDIATGDIEALAGRVTPMAGPGGRVIPVGDVFNPIPQAPGVVGYGGSATAGGGGVRGGTGGGGRMAALLSGEGGRSEPRLKGIGGRGAEIDQRGGNWRAPVAPAVSQGGGGYAGGGGEGGPNMSGWAGGGAADKARNLLPLLSLLGPLFGIGGLAASKLLPKRPAPDYGGIGPDTEWGPPTNLNSPEVAPRWGSEQGLPQEQLGGGFEPQGRSMWNLNFGAPRR